MTEFEKERFAIILDSVKNGDLYDFPSSIIDYADDGLKNLANDLIISGFLD